MNAIISGGSKGIGKAIAMKFLENGYNVAICGRNEGALNQFKSDALELSYTSDILTFVTDISRPEGVKSFAKACLKKYKTIDILVNNAGIFIPGKITEEKSGKLEKMMETNLYSAYHLSREIIPYMKDSSKPHIFNICSIASIIAYPNGGSYSISKFAMLGFSKVLREELKPMGIKVTSILPGATWSDSWLGAEIPYERIMEAKDIADTVWSAYQLGPSSVVEEIILRPTQGDL
ncbi:MAG: SDR family oxidoreductase [Saprospiraceae bacterium]|nr:SDR family oxidoreductase [Saprospiraceae bacterium]